MTAEEYKEANKEMERLIESLTIKKKLTKKQHEELDLISERIAAYEEANFPFQVESLKEMIEL